MEKIDEQTVQMIDTAIIFAVKRIAKGVLEIYKVDPHEFSKRPCSTCRAISTLLSEPWGCENLREQNNPPDHR